MLICATARARPPAFLVQSMEVVVDTAGPARGIRIDAHFTRTRIRKNQLRLHAHPFERFLTVGRIVGAQRAQPLRRPQLAAVPGGSFGKLLCFHLMLVEILA